MLFLLFISLFSVCSLAKVVRLKGSSLSVKFINESDHWIDWISKKESIQCIINHYPSLNNIRFLSSDIFQSDLLTLSYPGITVKQTIDYDIFTNETTVILSSKQGSIKQSYHGTKTIVNIFNQLAPSDVKSTIIICLHKHGKNMLSIEEHVEILLSCNIPAVAQSIQMLGSRSIQKQVSANTIKCIDKVYNSYNTHSTSISNQNNIHTVKRYSEYSAHFLANRTACKHYYKTFKARLRKFTKSLPVHPRILSSNNTCTHLRSAILPKRHRHRPSVTPINRPD